MKSHFLEAFSAETVDEIKDLVDLNKELEDDLVIEGATEACSGLFA